VRADEVALQLCPVCGGREFSSQKVLWPELIEQWQLSDDEAASIDLQQGYHCSHCKSNLRSMTLAAAVVRAFRLDGSFQELCRTSPQLRAQVFVEVNQAGSLTASLSLLPKHQLVCFPEVDLEDLKFDSDSVDVIIHSDTLEHVPESSKALKECYRVLRPGAWLFYTVPVIIGRLTKKRNGMMPSYHGNAETRRSDLIVQTEYGADFWCEVFAAGFREIHLTSLMFPASIAIAARKG
jgi:SAM-dependent methyltransferase